MGDSAVRGILLILAPARLQATNKQLSLECFVKSTAAEYHV